jgi:serine/threonine-protein kinase
VTATWIASAFAVGGGLIFFGVFSFAVIAMVIGVYWFALGNSLWRALFVYLIGMAVQGTVATLIITGVIEDPGFLSMGPTTPRLLAVCEVLFLVITAATFYTARASRHATLSVVTDYERVVRALGQRDGLLQEAREDLERALHQGGMGRFSGETLGSYRLGPVIGRGGMGEVYEATHATTGEPAAVKLLQPARLGNTGVVMRFLREVELASSISIPQIVRVLEVSDASSPVPYLAMELLRGRDLAEILRDRRRLDADAVVDLLDQVGRGVDAAAAARIVHRDLKPQNLFLVEAPGSPRAWKILDFGISKLLGESAELTQNRVIGTPMYMAPEQALGRPVDAHRPVRAGGDRLPVHHRRSALSVAQRPVGHPRRDTRDAGPARCPGRGLAGDGPRPACRHGQGPGRALRQRGRAHRRDRSGPPRPAARRGAAPRRGAGDRPPVASALVVTRPR